MNCLQLIQQATGELGIPVPNFVAGNTASDTVQQLALLNAVGYELLTEYDWQALSKEYRFTTQYLITTGNTTNGSAVVTGIPSTAGLDSTYMVAATGINQDTYIQSVDSATQVTLSQPCTATGTGVAISFGKTKYTLPTDFDHQVDRTHYDKSKRWAMLGPETAQQWQFLKSSYISTGPRLRYRIMGGTFQIWPLVATPEYLGFEYQSKYWVNNGAAGSFTTDTDTCIFADRLMTVGLKRKYLEIKGFDSSSVTEEYNRLLMQLKAQEHGAPTLSMNPEISEVLIGYENIPDTGYGS